MVTSTDPRLLTDAEAQQARYGGQHFITKPFDIEALLQTVRELIGRADSADADGALGRPLAEAVVERRKCVQGRRGLGEDPRQLLIGDGRSA